MLSTRMTKPPPRLLVFIVFALVLTLRLHHAWVQRFSTDADRDIAQLMSRHVAEGREWPIFFYGQCYMGSLEPLCGAVFCRLLGTSAFTAALGTAIPGAAVALLAWLIARVLAGPWAALYAAAFFVTGSPAFSSYMGNPRGGYAFVLLLGTWCLYLGARIAEREWKGDRPPLGWYALLGLVAGAAWWTSAIVAAALAAAALVVAIGLRGRLLKLRIVAGLAGFAVGASPWLLWNVQNAWASMSMSSSLGAMRLSDSVPMLLRRVCELAGLGQPAWSPALLGGLMLILIAASVFVPLRNAIRQRATGPLFQFTALLAFTLLFILSYVISSFARIETLRYLLPLVPVLAVLAGLALGTLTRSLPLAAHIPVLLVVMGGQLAAGNIRLRVDEAQQRQQERGRELGRQAQAEGFDTLFAVYALHWVNFGSDESVPVVDPGGERYSIYARQGLLSEQPAWLADPQGVSGFLKHTASAWQTSPSPLGSLIHHTQAPSTDWNLVTSGQVTRVTDQDKEDVQDLVLDGNLATTWRADSDQREPAELLVQLNQPTTLRGLKLYSANATYPLYLAIAGRNGPDAPWIELQASRYVNRYHWSGALAYWQNLYFSVEARFTPTTVTELRISFPPSAKRSSYRIRLSEITLLDGGHGGTDPRPIPARNEVADLIQLLQTKGTTELLADRWVSDRVAASTGHTIRVRSSADLNRDVDDSPQDDEPIYTLCEPARGTAFLVPPGATATTEARLRDLGFHPTRHTTGLGTLILLEDDQNDSVARPGPLAWFGDALFSLRSPGDEIYVAHGLFEQSERAQKTDPVAAGRLLEACLLTDPLHVPALERFLEVAEAAHPDRPVRATTLRQLTQPHIPCAVRFSNGMRFEGCTVEPAAAAPGSTLTVTYYWRAPREVDYADLNTFVHVRNKKLIWQDDHAALTGQSESRIRRPPYDAPLVVTRQTVIPPDAPPGSYDLALGLVRKSKAKRVLAWGSHVRWDRSIYLRDAFVVTPP